MFGTAFTTATMLGRNSSTNSNSATSETPCTYPQSEEENDAEFAAEDESKDMELPKGLGSSNSNHINMIEKLRDLHIGELIGLPQLVVVGDQGSGKSSVLEAITELPFPRSDGLCTRFATNIVFLRDLKTSISVSIFSPNQNTSKTAKFNSLMRDKIEKLDETTFLGILKKVCSYSSWTW